MGQSASHACHLCFNDKTLKDYIRKEGKRGWCDWCGARNVYALPLDELGDIFREVVSIYKQGDTCDDTISYLLQGDWDVFSDRIEQAPNDLMQELTVALLKAGIDIKDYAAGEYPDYNGFFRRKADRLVEHWHEIAEAYYLEQEKTANNALPLSPHHIISLSIEDLPDQLEAVFEDLSILYKPGKILFRARIHDDRFRNDWFNLSEVGAPPPEKTPAGRANRKGEPIMYLASDSETAIAEVRAWKGMAVAIAKFEVRTSLSVVNLRKYSLSESPFFEEYLEWKIQMAALFDRLAEELSRPVLSNKKDNIYFSTQYLCDWIKKTGHAGIEYPSAMGDGYNVAIFNPTNMKAIDVKYVRVDEVIHKYNLLDKNTVLYEECPFDYLFK